MRPTAATRKRSAAAFTLMDVAVGVAVSAVLMAVALRAGATHRADARVLSCQANLRLLGMAMHAYADGQNGYLPPHWLQSRKIPWFANERYREILGLEMKSRGMPNDLLCPDRPEKRQGSVAHVYGQNVTGAPVVNAPEGTSVFVQLTAVPSPAERVMLHDANEWSTRSGGADDQKGWNVTGEKLPAEGGKGGLTAYRHRESANVLHHDLSAQLYDKRSLFPRTASGAPNKNAVDKLWRMHGGKKGAVNPAGAAAKPPTPAPAR